jgi:hypothetical protein
VTRKKHGNYELVTYKGDHLPYHVHIRRNGREVGRWDIENQKPMDRFRVTREILDALRASGYYSEETE